MKLVVSGSRSINDYEFVKNAILDVVSTYSITKLLHGAARGVDILADKAAKELGIEVEKYPAEWKKYGRSAGLRRNRVMAEKADLLLAIWDGFSPGTSGMIQVMRTLNKSVIVKMHMRFNVWDYLGKADAICVTTNGYVTRKGKAVMGRGIAKQAVILFEGIDYKLGSLLRKHGNHVQIIETCKSTNILSFPVKPEKVKYATDKVVKHALDKYKNNDIVPGYYARADIEIIRRSCAELEKLIKEKNWKEVYLPLPGSGAGELSKEESLEILKSAGLLELVRVVDRAGIITHPFFQLTESKHYIRSTLKRLKKRRR